MRALLASESFWSPQSRGTLVKSPVELVVGTLRVFDVRPMDLRPAALVCAMLGQTAVGRPNVKGWPGGEAWSNSSTLLGRKRAVEGLLRNDDGGGPQMPAADMRGAAREPGERLRRAMERGLAAYRVDWMRWWRE